MKIMIVNYYKYCMLVILLIVSSIAISGVVPPMVEQMKINLPKKLMVIMIDMDTMAASINIDAISIQKEVLEFAAKNNYPILDVQMGGTTDAELRSITMKSKNYFSYKKKSFGLFGTINHSEVNTEIAEKFNISSNKTLSDWMKEDLEVNDLYEFGFYDECCVLHTVLGSIQNDFNVYVDREMNPIRDDVFNVNAYDLFRENNNFHDLSDGVLSRPNSECSL